MRSFSRLAVGLAMATAGAALVALDLWTKALAASHLAGRGTVRLLGDFAVLVFSLNRGAFLSLGSGLPPTLRSLLLVAFPLAALAFLGWAVLSRGLGLRGGPGGRAGGRLRERAVLVLIAAGGIGNLVDRVLYGEVRDFLNFGIGRLRTGIMNLADLYILAALVLIAISLLAGRRR
jgi:signal peptidase II